MPALLLLLADEGRPCRSRAVIDGGHPLHLLRPVHCHRVVLRADVHLVERFFLIPCSDRIAGGSLCNFMLTGGSSCSDGTVHWESWSRLVHYCGARFFRDHHRAGDRRRHRWTFAFQLQAGEGQRRSVSVLSCLHQISTGLLSFSPMPAQPPTVHPSPPKPRLPAAADHDRVRLNEHTRPFLLHQVQVLQAEPAIKLDGDAGIADVSPCFNIIARPRPNVERGRCPLPVDEVRPTPPPALLSLSGAVAVTATVVAEGWNADVLSPRR